MIEGKTPEETIQKTAEALGIDPVYAGFIYDLEHGHTHGDVLIEGVDDEDEEATDAELAEDEDTGADTKKPG